MWTSVMKELSIFCLKDFKYSLEIDLVCVLASWNGLEI